MDLIFPIAYQQLYEQRYFSLKTIDLKRLWMKYKAHFGKKIIFDFYL